MHAVLSESRREHHILWIGIPEDCEQPLACWELSLSPLLRAATGELSLQLQWKRVSSCWPQICDVPASVFSAYLILAYASETAWILFFKTVVWVG